ncbi:glutathione S-transferase [Thozetella sp. PMI_491]|nr:glutathione S-transferase [Thozetella sp. PMI_491]
MGNELFLWDHPVSPYAQKVRIALREKNISFRYETPKGAGSGNRAAVDPNFLEQNHRVEVPMLVDGELKIFDSTIILEYLDDKYPKIPLRPSDPESRARARMIEDVCDSQYEAINWGMGEIENFKRLEGVQAEQLRNQAKHQVAQLHEWLTFQLGSAEWFGGESFGWADVCVWPFVNRSTSYGIEPATGTPLRDWYERAKERESVAAVFAEFETGVKGQSGAADALKNGLLKRQYRDHRLEWMIKSGGIKVILDGLENSNIRFSWPSPL